MSAFRLWQLAARKLTQDISLEELKELEQLLKAHPELATQLELHSHYFMLSSKNDDENNESRKAWEQQLKELHRHFPNDFWLEKKKRVNKMRLRILSFAAVILLITGGFSWFYFRNEPKQVENTIAANADIQEPIQSANNSYRTTLPDGSTVVLNKNSRIYLNKGFGNSNRSVKLEGEAFFDVAHNAQMPFTVQARSVKIKVLGTAFNVRAYADEQEVQASLIRGSLEVTEKNQKHIRILLKPNEKISIPIGEGLNIEKRREPLVDFAYKKEPLQAEESSGVVPETAWMEHKLVFNSEPLSNVVEKMEKWYDVSISIEDNALANEKFTGAFENETITEALTALQFTFPFQFNKTRKGKFIIKR